MTNAVYPSLGTLASESWMGLSRGARLLYCLLPLAGTDEDRARFCADPYWLADLFYPGTADGDVTPEVIAGWLLELNSAELIRLALADADEDCMGVVITGSPRLVA